MAKDFIPMMARHDGALYRLSFDVALQRFNLHRVSPDRKDEKLVVSSLRSEDCSHLVGFDSHNEIVMTALKLRPEGEVLDEIKKEEQAKEATAAAETAEKGEPK